MKICKIGRRGLPLQCKGVMLIGAKLPLARTMCAILGVVCLLLTGCYAETYDAEETSTLKGKSQVVLTFVTPNNSSTRSATEDPDGYEDGIGYEDDINISGHDYKIYFFTYDSSNKDAGTLIAEFTPTEIKTVEASTYTSYMVTGEVPATLMAETDFRVVMLANWGMWYPSVTVGTTTIDDLCEGENTTFNAFKKFTIDQDNLIPFYGVQEYTDISFSVGETTTLSTPVSLLRAVAKVEVILTADSDVESFDDVSIVNYNSQGYCAPAGVYTADDYDTEMKNNPSSGNWADEWVKDLHLVGSANDTGTKTQVFTQISDANLDTWRIYLPEYDNVSSTDDYSYITVTIDDTPYNIYFAEYTDGETDNTAVANRYNLKRNNIYRFYVTLKNRELRVFVETWENVFDNEWTFGVTEPEDVGATFFSNNIMYKVLTSTVSDPNAELTVCTTTGSTFTSEVEIPSTIRHNGFTYTVTEIGDYTFDGKMVITKIILPETIEAIGSKAFNGCTYLTELYIYSYSPPTYQDDTFEGLTLGNVTLYVPYEVKDVEDEYNQEPWTNFKEIKAIPGTEPENKP